MLKKKYSKDGKRCRVTFDLTQDAKAETAYLCGDFNDWDKRALPMKRRKNGSYYVGMTVEVGQEYRFRYWLDDQRWENDWEADAYAPNDFGTEDSILKV